jgi:tetratricopeptide (TPR) repeat protein/glycosyltransferase involved in cell wall biosynthesis
LGLIIAKRGYDVEFEKYGFSEMVTAREKLAIAQQHHQAGRFAEAEHLCRQILKWQPQQPEALHLLGRTLHQSGNLVGAIACYQQLLSLRPQDPQIHNNLGVAFKVQGQIELAIDHYQQALALQPNAPGVHNNLGNLWRQQGQLEEALAAYQQAIAIDPNYADALNSLGLVLREQGQTEAAIAHYQQMLARSPQNADAYNHLGNAFQEQKQFEAAIPCYQKALQLRPDAPAFYNNLGAALQELNRLTASIAAYQQAIALKLDYPDAYYNLGNALRNQDRFEAAIAAYRQAIVLQPNYPQAFNNLGLVLYELNQLTASIAAYQQALILKPNYPDAHLNLSLSLLTLGQLQQGFQEYEYRWQVQGKNFKPPRNFDQPLWDGSPLTGQTILLHAEQGFGDTIQFIRYAALVAERGGRVVVECQVALIRLLRSIPSIQSLVAAGTPLPAFQVHTPLLSLPRLLETTSDTIPAQIPYLQPPSTSWQLEAPPGVLKVGLVWAGSPDHQSDRHRSCPFTHFLKLLDLPGICFYSLQKGDRTADLSQAEGRIQDLGEQLEDFADTAAAIAQLDLMISVDTSVAHVAGALGHPVWVLLSFAPDWRWQRDRSDTPWYPTMRLFRQAALGDWNGAIDQVIAALRQWQTTAVPRQPSAQPTPTVQSLSLSEALAFVRQCLTTGRLSDAEIICQQILKQRPDQPEVLSLLGTIAYQSKQFALAADYYRQSIALNPDVAAVHINLGNTLRRLGQLEAAIAHYRQAISLEPNSPLAYNNLGVTLRQQGDCSAAIASYHQALALDTNHSDAYFNLANALKDQEDLTAAVGHYRQAIAIRPNYTSAWANLGNVLKAQGQVDQAIACYRQVLAIDPNHASAHNNLGHALLLSGDLPQGFAETEWRWQVKSYALPRPPLSQPRWDGSDLTGRTLLVYAEQGLGDTIQFIRYAPLVAKMVASRGSVILECQPALVRLVQSVEGIQQIIPRGETLPAFDLQVPLLSLPHLLGTTLDNIPTIVPYLTAPESAIDLDAPSERLKVGLVWAGSSTNGNDRHRSCALHWFSDLLDLPGVSFYSLQKGDRAGDLQQFAEAEQIIDLSQQLDDFADTSAAIAQLDLVISVDTAVAHLAGALGKPVWILLCFDPDWRWLLERSTSPWYPTARLFRQPALGDWTTVLTQVKAALAAMLLGNANAIDRASFAQPSTQFNQTACPPQLGIGWQLSSATGWGIYGINLALHLLQTHAFTPVSLLPVSTATPLNPLHLRILQPMLNQRSIQLKQTSQVNFPILKGLGNQFVTAPELEQLSGSRNIGVIFFENTALSLEALQRAKRFDRIIAGSTWNAEILKTAGLTTVRTAFQGIDPTIFHPGDRTGLSEHRLFKHRFVIFSGGKLEYRKGQDIVIQAFKEFQSRHPEALLLAAWHNFWANTMVGLERTGYVQGLPQVDAKGRLQIGEWLVANGISDSAFIDLGIVPNDLMGQILREADVSIFPNRCEGGTNLAAMESLACGIPTILSANTGHLDLLGDHCYALRSQSPVKPSIHGNSVQGFEGWGESSVEEVLEMLEVIYGDRQSARQRGQSAAQFMQDWTWDQQIERLLSAIADQQ